MISIRIGQLNWSTSAFYDNQRIMGGIDWLQQGQSHDAVLVTKQEKWLPIGFRSSVKYQQRSLVRIGFRRTIKI